MKSSVAVLAAAATVAMAKPEFLNTNFDVTPGEPFTLKFDGCDDGCDIILLNGDPDDLKEVQTLVKDVTGSEETITLSERFSKDTYAFRIVDSDGQENYSEQFDFDGDDSPQTTEVETTTAEETTSTSTEETTTAEETTTEETTSEVTTTEAETTISTPDATTTSTGTPTGDADDSEETGDDDDSDSAPSDDDDGAATRLGSSYVALAAAVVALAGFVL